MPKARYAERGKPKPKSVKSKAVLSGSRLQSRKGKKQKAGTQGAVSEYIPRTRAIKRLQITLRDFRRLCILKGIYPRDPKNKKHLDPTQTYYHHKDIQYLAHEPLMRKLHTQKVRAQGGGARACVRARVRASVRASEPCSPRRARRSSCAASSAR